MRVNDARRPFPECVPPRIVRRVALREPGDLLLRLLDAVPQQKPVPVRQRQEPPGVDVPNLESIFAQLQVFDDFRLKQVAKIRTRRETVPRKQFLCDARAAENVAPLQQSHFQAGLREICGGHQSIVSTAKNDDVVINGRHDTNSICAAMRSRLTEREKQEEASNCRRINEPLWTKIYRYPGPQ